jgi:hypothetical protein
VNLRKDHFNNKQQQKTFLTPRFSLLRKKPLALSLLGAESSSEFSFLQNLFFSHQTFGLGYQRDECKRIKQYTPFNDGPLGSRNDEERGKMRKCSMNCRI